MKRRNSLIFLGSILSGSSLYSYKKQSQPVVALSYNDFIAEDSISIDTASGEFGKLLIKFNKFKIEGNNITDKDDITVRINADINDVEKSIYSKNIDVINNSVNKSLDDIKINLLDEFDIDDFTLPEEEEEQKETDVTINVSIDEMDFDGAQSYEDTFTVKVRKINETLFATGSIKVTETGEIKEEVGFEPDYLEFTSFVQIPEISNGSDNDSDFYEYISGRNEGCNSNETGWTLGAAVLDENEDIKQRSLSSARSSNSTNGHRVASSTEYVINHMYVGQDAYLCNGDDSRLRCNITEFTEDGFNINVDSKPDNFDEEIPYRAFSVGNGECDVGFHKISEEGTSTIDLGFKPNLLNIRSNQKVTSENFEKRYHQDDFIATAGTSQGKCVISDDIKQYCMTTAESSDSTNNHISVLRDDLIINNIYVDRDADVYGRLECTLENVNDDGIEIDSQNTYDDSGLYSSEIILYRAFDLPDDIEVEIGVKKIDSSGETSIDDIGFRASNIDLVSYQHVSEINTEYKPGSNVGDKNANGFSEGWISGSISSTMSISVGRTSDSQDAHRTRSSLRYILNNIYVDNDGDKIGEQLIEPKEITDSGLKLNVDKYHTDEMILYQAINDT